MLVKRWLQYRQRWGRTGVRPKYHQGVIFDKSELADLTRRKSDCGEGGLSGGTDTVDRVQHGAIDVAYST